MFLIGQSSRSANLRGRRKNFFAISHRPFSPWLNAGALTTTQGPSLAAIFVDYCAFNLRRRWLKPEIGDAFFSELEMDVTGFIPRAHALLELKTVPIPIANLIWEYLDLEATSTLFATFDKSIQRQLTSSRAISFIDAPKTVTGAVRYLMRSARNVGTMRLGFDVSWRLPAFELLTSLNPTSLFIGSESISSTIRKQFYGALHPEIYFEDVMSADELKSLKQSFTPSAWPNFAHLTPNLQILTIDCDPNSMASRRGSYGSRPNISDPLRLSEDLVLPPRLTSLEINKIIFLLPETIVAILPKGLTALKLDFSASITIELSFILSTLVRLQTLALTSHHIKLEQVPEEADQSPATEEMNLTNLRLSYLSDFPLPFLQSGFLRRLPLERLYFEAPPYLKSKRSAQNCESIDLSLYLPTSLTAFHLKQTPGQRSTDTHVNIMRLPSKLTEATIEIGTFDPLLIPALMKLAHLHTIRLVMLPSSRVHLYCSATGGSAPHQSALALLEAGMPQMLPLEIPALPIGLTSLSITSTATRPFSEERARLLPDSLKTLYLSHCELETAIQIRSVRPNCSIVISTPLNAWDSNNAEFLRSEREHLWSPVLDCQAFEDDVLRTYGALKIFLKLEWDITTSKDPLVESETPEFDISSLVWRPTSKRLLPAVDERSTFPVHDFIKTSFPHLTKLVLRIMDSNESLPIFSDALPSALTHLEVSKIDIRFFDCMLPSSLTYLTSDSYYHTAEPTLPLQAFPDLIYLDAPLWTFWLFDLVWEDHGIQKLNTCIAGLMDTMVVRFLRDEMTAETRLNASISLEYYESGRLLDIEGNHSNPNAMDQDRAVTTRSTSEILNDLLSAPMEDFTSATQSNPDLTSVNLINAPLKSIRSLGRKKIAFQPKPKPEFIPRKITLF